jgi:DNA-binding SARP family transcriptional activator/Tfp pilus assembly protein PilF
MKFQVLGPVEICVGERTLDAGHARQRAVLAVLLLDLGRVVPAERLIDRVWGEDPPPSARSTLYGYIARLRAILASAADGEATLSRQRAGYLLQAEPDQLDLHRFRTLAALAATAADDDTAERLVRQALSLWHGPALAGADSPWLTAMRDTLELERHAAQLDLNDISLRLGQHAALAAELISQAAADPADERLIGQLMLALYRSGRQADALRQFDQTRRYLAGELGTDPAPELSELHQQILRADPALAHTPPGTTSTPSAGSPPAAPVPRELPADVAAFTGRATELDELDELLLGPQNTTAAVISAVSGTAGVGKTALAVHWAHHASRHFPDGQLHINLRGYDPDQPMPAADALATFLGSLGVPGQDIPQAEADRAARYRSLLVGKRTLIVLDNAATVEQVRPLLPGHPECRVLVTSRDSLAGLVARDGARRLELDLLHLDDAVWLLRELIGARVDAETDAAVTLAEQCARLPLALRIAAELAISRADAPLGKLAAELEDQQARLNLLDSGSDPRTAVRAVFSWSYDHLDHDTARAFRFASLGPGPDFDTYALAALTGRSLEQARQDLHTLTRAHLVQCTRPGRYNMHDLLRAYARDLAAEHDSGQQTRAALTRLFDYYLSVAATAMDTLYPAERHRRPHIADSPSPAPTISNLDAARKWLDVQRASLVLMVSYAVDNGWAGHSIRMSGALWRYLEAAGHFSDAVSVHSAARRAARQAGDLAAEAQAVMALGVIGWHQGRYQEAADHHEQALVLYRNSADRIGQARALHNLALVEQERGNYLVAVDHDQQSLALLRDVGDVTGQTTALNSLGNLFEGLGRYEDAASFEQEALALSREIGYELGEAVALGNLGVLDERLGRYEQAAERYRQALAIFRQIGDRKGEAASLCYLGSIDRRLGRYQSAARSQRHALDIFRAIGDPGREAESRNALGEILLAEQRPDDAQREHAIALQLARQIGQKQQQAQAHDGHGRCHLAKGEFDLAREHWREAVALFTELGAPEADKIRTQLAEATAHVEPVTSE